MCKTRKINKNCRTRPRRSTRLYFVNFFSSTKIRSTCQLSRRRRTSRYCEHTHLVLAAVNPIAVVAASGLSTSTFAIVAEYSVHRTESGC